MPAMQANAPAEPLSQTRQRWTLVAMILASGSVFLNGSVVNVALPVIDRQLQAGFSGLQWVVDGYLLTLSALLILGGALGDRFGRRRVMLIGLSGFGVTLLWCGLATNTTWLIAGRLLQGAAGALLVPGALAVLRSAYTDPTARGGAIGSWSGWSGISTVIGPLLGGWLIEVLSWRWVFFINIPVVLITGWLMLKYVPESRSQELRGPIDLTGALLVTIALAGLAYGLIEAPALGWADPQIITSFGGALSALLLLLWVESRAANPLLPFDLFRNQNFSAANLTTLGLYAALQGTTFLLVIYLQNIMGFSPLASGLILTPISLLLLVLSPWIGRLAGKHGARLFLTTGPLICALGLGLMTLIQPNTSLWTALIPIVAIFGIGMGLTVAPLTNTVISAVSEQRTGLASAFNNMVSRVGGLLAIAILGVIVSASFSSAIQSQIQATQLQPNMRQLLTEIAGNPTASGQVEQLSEPAQQAYQEAFTRSFHMSMAFTAGMAASGGVLAFLLIQPLKAHNAGSSNSKKE